MAVSWLARPLGGRFNKAYFGEPYIEKPAAQASGGESVGHRTDWAAGGFLAPADCTAAGLRGGLHVRQAASLTVRCGVWTRPVVLRVRGTTRLGWAVPYQA